MSDTKYVTRLALGQCSMGTMTNYLNLPEDHGVIKNDMDHPLMNANDHEPGKHVIHFGRCNSQANPGNSFNLGSALLGSLLPGSTLIKNLIGCGGCKCTPMTFMPWVEKQKEHLLEGAPALTVDSKLMCFYGGEITILPPEDAEKEEADYKEATHAEYDE